MPRPRPRACGAEGRLFGSVTAHEVAEAIEEQTGIVVPAKRLAIDEPIKSVGEHQLTAQLHTAVTFPVRIEVVEA